jgi:UDP:flavonoid glycosyltransferase YjiC (YdhE family)
MSRPLEAAFVVLGEGRGHMTQALAASAFLRNAGHRVTAVYLGVSPFQPVPRYFAAHIGAPVVPFSAVTLIADAHGRGMSVARTAAYNLPRIPEYVGAGFALRDAIHRLRPDVVVNFYDLVAGFVHIFNRWSPPPPRVALAHAYLLGHPSAAAPPPGLRGRYGLALLSAITSAGVQRPLGLSFDPLPDTPSVEVTPPLLRPGLDRVETTDGGYMLAYVLNGGYARDLAAWQSANSSIPVHCYVSGGGRALGIPGGPGFALHDLDDDAFLRHLCGCRAYVGTSGFESVCEAFYLGKPVLAFPVDAHYEQAFNAADLRRTGMARVGGPSDLDRFWSDLPIPPPEKVLAFRRWVARAPAVFVAAVERAARRGGRWRR